MRYFAKSLVAAAIAIFLLQDIAAGQSLPVPPNQIMPRLPPVPQAPRARRSAAPCKISQADIPKGGTVPATGAKQTPNGIQLYGGEDAPPARTNSPCPTH